jgi:hypothetical protein
MKYLARWVVAFAFAFTFTFTDAALVQAGSFNLPAHGGDGGSSFSLDCGNDKVLIGVIGLKAEWLDRLQPKCTWVSTSGNWVGGLFTSGTAGGGGGESFSVTCPRDTAIKGISGRYGWYVNRLYLRCRPLGASGSNSTISAAGSQSGNQSFTVEFCPNGEPARGFYGRASGYVDRIGLICHTGATPTLQVLASPSERVAVNLVTPQGPSTTELTPFVQIQWTDQSTIEGGFSVVIRGPLQVDRTVPTPERIINRPAADGIGSRQAVTITDLPSGGYFLRVCARFSTADGGDRCPIAPSLFGVAAAATCSPVITSPIERIGAGTGRVRWSHSCNNPTSFVVRLRSSNSPFVTVATTGNGSVREETFANDSIFLFGGALQVCASFPGQAATDFCSAEVLIQGN